MIGTTNRLAYLYDKCKFEYQMGNDIEFTIYIPYSNLEGLERASNWISFRELSESEVLPWPWEMDIPLANIRVKKVLKINISTSNEPKNQVSSHNNQNVETDFTIDFISFYLDSSSVREVSFNELLDPRLDLDMIYDFISTLNYSDYLKTSYWKAISIEKKRQVPICQLCGKDKNLETHHPPKIYKEIIGREIKYLNLLLVLCRDCHEKAPRN